MMIVLFWFLGILIMSIFIGELRFRRLRTLKNINKMLPVGEWTDSIEKEIDVLEIECPRAYFVPTTKLAMRGSWRLAQDSIMSINDFVELREYEYSKKLR